MPASIIAAGVAAVGAVVGAVTKGKALSKAERLQREAADRQIARADANRDYQYNLNAPTINQGQRASDILAGFTGVGGDAAASADALQTFRNSTGYTDLQREGARSTNAAVFSGGLGQSGAALRALQERATQIANGSSQQFFGNVSSIASRGDNARGLVAGIGQNTVSGNNQVTQNLADNQSNIAFARADNTSGLIQGLLNAGASAYGSSYRLKTPTPSPTYSQIGPR
jgi:hypothetical protein